MADVLVAWVWLGCVVLVAGCAWRAWRYMRAPVHLRWDLYPVAHEPNDYGGSHLEHKDWFDKPRKVNFFGELVVMGEEILLLKGVLKNNRSVWWGSLPFHWGLYLMIVTSVGLTVAALGFAPGPWLVVVAQLGALSGVLLTVGSLLLLALRASDPRLKPYPSPLDLVNLALLAVLGALSTAVAVSLGMGPVAAAMADVLRMQTPEVSLLLGTQMALAALFLLYFPATRMVHMFAKYFTYHSVRWDDRPREAGSAMDRRLMAALNFGVSWSAEHIRTGKTWVEVATQLPSDEEKR